MRYHVCLVFLLFAGLFGVLATSVHAQSDPAAAYRSADIDSLEAAWMADFQERRVRLRAEPTDAPNLAARPRFEAGASPAGPSGTGATTTFVVNSTYDDPDNAPGDGICATGFAVDIALTIIECSLRAAIEEANATAGSDPVIINIDILSVVRGADFSGTFGYDSVNDWWTISPDTLTFGNQFGPLPPVMRQNVTIDATTQFDGSDVGTFPDATCGSGFGSGRVLKVAIDGMKLEGPADGLEVQGDHSLVRGLVFKNIPGAGIFRNGAVMTIDCVHSGTDFTGSAAEPNVDGIRSEVNGLTRTATITRSLLSGNMKGINQVSASITVQESLIGTNLAGTSAIPNTTGIENSPDTLSVTGSVVSGNTGSGINLNSFTPAIYDNLIGTDAGGTYSIANGNGIEVFGTFGVTIGPFASNPPNVISGNGTAGVILHSANNSVVGNLIGTDISGTAPIPNGFSGVAVLNTDNRVGPNNTISGNAGIGVHVLSSDAVIEGNRIGTDHTGSTAVANNSGIEDSGQRTLIGGSTPDARNVISGNATTGVSLFGIDATVLGNYIGTDGTGSTSVPNGTNGIFDQGSRATIGGTAVDEGNLISGNGRNGILLIGTDAKVYGNLIGTDVAGSTGLSNGEDGVEVHTSATNTEIGTPGAGNVISGNGQNGIEVIAGNAGVVILANYIGIDKSGFNPLPNSAGVLDSGSATFIGGTNAGEGNVVSGNLINGLSLFGRAFVFGNLIGTDTGGSAPVPNVFNGVFVGDGLSDIALNTIAYNQSAGVAVVSTGTANVNNNSMYDNTGLGIDLKLDGVTPNDLLDVDSGPNNLQNFPLIHTAHIFTGLLFLELSLHSSPSDTFSIEFFKSVTPDPSGFGEGRESLGPIPGFVTDGSGNISASGSIPLPVVAGEWLTATATRVSGPGEQLGTSEFSGAIQITEGPIVQLTSSKVFLEGPYSGGIMSTTLAANGDVPLMQPYADAAFSGTPLQYLDPKAVAALPPDVVDWIVLSLRLDPSPVSEAGRAVAFVRDDGSIVDVLGSSNVNFLNTSPGSYHLVACHRNHLCAISSTLLDFSAGTASHDFTANVGYISAGLPQQVLETSPSQVFGLFAADAKPDGDVQALDFNEYITATTSGASGYQQADFNLDGNVQALDFNLYIANTVAGASSQVP